jgi:Zn finger protein HypA/HybF involved in hydrogenase expression
VRSEEATVHELSLALALYDLAMEHVPPGHSLRGVTIKVGPMRCVEPEAMQMAWASVVAVQGVSQASLYCRMSPWQLRCPRCDRRWEDASLESTCTCGCEVPTPAGDDELTLISIEVDESPEVSCERAGG